DIVVGPDAALWFTAGTNLLGRITTAGVYTGYTIFPGGWPGPIIVGPDGALWFTELSSAKIGRITVSNPSPPTKLTTRQSGDDGTQILLTWNYGSEPIDGFIVER